MFAYSEMPVLHEHFLLSKIHIHSDYQTLTAYLMYEL